MHADAALAVQYAIVAIVVLWSAWVVMKKQMPGTTRRLRIALALPLVREDRPPWLRRLGLRIAPPGANAATACGGCSDCGPPKR